MSRKEHPEQGVRAALGTLSLAKKYTKERLNAACRRAVHHGSYTVRSIRNILEHNLETQPIQKPTVKSLGHHENVRGPGYYGSESHDVHGQKFLFPPDAEPTTSKGVA